MYCFFSMVVIVAVLIFVHVCFPNGTVYLPRGTVILVMSVVYANPAGSAVSEIQIEKY